MRTFVVLLFVCGIVGCHYGELCDCAQPDQELVYVNRSGIPIKLTATVEKSQYNIMSENDSVWIDYYKQTIDDGDSLCNANHNTSCSDSTWQIQNRNDYGCEFIDISNGHCTKSVDFTIEFATIPKKCLKYSGPDIFEDDIRYWSNYTRMDNFFQKIEASCCSLKDEAFFYTITPEHLAMAKSEYCPQTAE
ncbi:MAG: hypothetical protein LBR60_08330 [Fibrobacter sp.]|jgi:hypothetical protein|nr:hypothetical protein [Fibrobacter sp.]